MLFSTVKYKYLAWIEGLRRAAQIVIIIFASHHRFLLRITDLCFASPSNDRDGLTLSIKYLAITRNTATFLLWVNG